MLNLDDFALLTNKDIGDARSGTGALSSLLHCPILRCQEQVYRHSLLGFDASNLVRIELSEPNLISATGCDDGRFAPGGWGRKLVGDDAASGDAPNLVPQKLSKPEVAIGACRDAERLAGSEWRTGGGKRELV